MTPWQKYVEAVTGGATQTAIGEATGIAQTTIGRWLRGQKAPSEAAQAAKFALAYDRNPLEAFVAAGMLSIDDAGRGLTLKERTFLVELTIPSDPMPTMDQLAESRSAAHPIPKNDVEGDEEPEGP